MSSPEKSIVLFDGACNFCNASVNFIARHDNRKQFSFIPFHSDKAKELLNNFGQSNEYFESLVLTEHGSIFFRSTAALKIAGKLDWKIRWVSVFIILPEFLRDKIYNWIAGHRYSWFGKKDNSCTIPGEEVNSDR